MDRLNLDFLEKIQAVMSDWSIEIGSDSNGLTLRFGYWKKLPLHIEEVVDNCLPAHLEIERQLVDEDDDCGELWNYAITRKKLI